MLPWVSSRNSFRHHKTWLHPTAAELLTWCQVVKLSSHHHLWIWLKTMCFLYLTIHHVEKKGVSYFSTVNMLSYHFESSPNGRWTDLYVYLSSFITFFRILCFFQKIKTLLCRVAFVLWSPLVLPPTNPPGRVSEVHPEAVGPRMGEAWMVEHPTKSTRKTPRFTEKLTRKTETKNTSPFLEFWLSERLEILTARSFGSLGLRHHRTLEFQAFPTTTTTTTRRRRRRRRSIFNIQKKKQRDPRMKPRNRLPARGQRLHLGESIGCALRESSAAEVSAWRAGNAPWFLQLEHQQQESNHMRFKSSILQVKPAVSIRCKPEDQRDSSCLQPGEDWQSSFSYNGMLCTVDHRSL